MRASGRQESWVVQSLVSGPTLVLGVILGKLLVSLPQSHLETGLTEVAAMLSAGGWKRATHRSADHCRAAGRLVSTPIPAISPRGFPTIVCWGFWFCLFFTSPALTRFSFSFRFHFLGGGCFTRVHACPA